MGLNQKSKRRLRFSVGGLPLVSLDHVRRHKTTAHGDMLNLKSLFIALAVALLGVAAHAQTLWRGTVAGMPPAEVKRLVPEAVPPEGKAGSLATGAVELLRVPNFELVNEQFSASFYFKNDKLSQVTLALRGTKSFESALRTFESVTEALRARYGPELSRKLPQGSLATAEATWLSGRTNIDLFVLSVAPGHLIFNINYQVRLAREADKL